MNDWTVKRKFAVVEADDFCDRYDRNGLNMLFYWKAKFPDFKITLFTIPDRTTDRMLELLDKHKDWIEIAVHGFNHESNFECYHWDYERTKALMNRVMRNFNYKLIFKAPGWTITGGCNGYPPSAELPIAKDPQCVYKALLDMGFTIIDRHYNVPNRPESDKIICIDDNPDFVHFHTWNMETGDINGKNGFQQIEENFGVPWDEKTVFMFMSDAINNNFFLPCKK